MVSIVRNLVADRSRVFTTVAIKTIRQVDNNIPSVYFK